MAAYHQFMTNVICGLTAKKLGSAPCPTLIFEYGTTFLVQCSGHPTPKHVHLLQAVLFQLHLEERWCIDVQTRRDISRTVEDRG